MHQSDRSVHLLGIDLGTTGSTAIVLDPFGTVVAHASHSVEPDVPRPSWSEQDPTDWWDATVQSIRAVLADDAVTPETIAGIGLTGQMHGLVLLGAGGDALRPAVLWNDQRTGAECDAITERVGADAVVEHTGNPVLPGFTAPKIEWVRTHEPEIYEQTEAFLLPKDYLRYCLTGIQATDVSDASGTSLFDVEQRRWSDAMCEAVQVPEAWRPRVTESAAVSARVHAAAAEATGLPEGTPVVGGAGDQAAQAVGTGIVEPGSAVVTLGTSGVVFAPTASYQHDPEGRLHAFCHAAPDTWHLMGVMLSAAGSLRWYVDLFDDLLDSDAEARGYERLLAEADEVPPGAEGLLFLPYLSGERTPHADPNARGVFFGLHHRHERAHLTRAVLEGVAFGLRESLDLMRARGVAPTEVRVSGGGAQSELWRRILATVLDAPLVHTTTPHGAAVGAALLAGVGGDVFPDVPTASQAAVQVQGRTAPMDATDPYDALFERYQALYPALTDQFDALAEATDAHDANS
ncbi:MAG: xylulokinase [Salinibacter sp.]|uniref:xylulokinase n=1 Tax=Salinibacter sp. TaxID=2065818 RepID=UPI0035D51274